MNDELRVYEEQTLWLLGQLEMNVREARPNVLTAAPPGVLEGNNLLAIARHAAAVAEAYVLGIACGQPVSRHRDSEFHATGEDVPAVLATLEALPGRMSAALAALEPATLDRRIVPDQTLYGLGEPRAMSAREAIVENIRHLGIHLGEMRLTRSILEGRR